ncbi:hypothetical protein P7K49_030423 [Saguinus oedipus]|uniref:Uncharacterized protein n=1 Tax=Saguinus oedipus TaxID=9490 RepID=A0ABQ9U250_SAGOE|nr:hypothetical protein P7K49_030423 [Saguinus oedipus]
MERQVRARLAVPVVPADRAGPDPGVSPAQVLLSEPEEAAALYRGLSRHPSLSAACLGPEVTTQYGGQYRTVHTEWTQRDLERMENIRFCRQYLVFHDGDSVVFAGPAGNSVETLGE